jgi:hypothetical protein
MGRSPLTLHSLIGSKECASFAIEFAQWIRDHATYSQDEQEWTVDGKSYKGTVDSEDELYEIFKQES